MTIKTTKYIIGARIKTFAKAGSFFVANMDEKDTNQEAKKGGTQNQAALYQQLAAHAPEAIAKLVELMGSRNDNIALGAAKTLLAKVVPDLRTTQITGENGEPIKFNIISGADYISALGKSLTASTAGSSYGSAEVQGANLAPESQEDNNSDKPIGEVESA